MRCYKLCAECGAGSDRPLPTLQERHYVFDFSCSKTRKALSNIYRASTMKPWAPNSKSNKTRRVNCLRWSLLLRQKREVMLVLRRFKKHQKNVTTMLLQFVGAFPDVIFYQFNSTNLTTYDTVPPINHLSSVRHNKVYLTQELCGSYFCVPVRRINAIC